MTHPPIAPIVRTVYKGPTDHRGSRIVATNVTSGARKVVPWDYALDPPENHFLAARTVLGDGWFIRSMCSEKNGGYLFATASADTLQTLLKARELLVSLGDYTGNVDRRTGIDRTHIVLALTELASHDLSRLDWT